MKLNLIRLLLICLIIINSLIIFGFSSQNGKESGNLSKSIIIKIAEILNVKEENKLDFIDIGEKVIRKLAHFSIYTSLGIWSYLLINTFKLKNKYKVIITTIWGIVYASSDEFHQMFSNGRTASLNDVFIDLLGVIFGILFVLLIIETYKKIKAYKFKNKNYNLE